MNLKPGRRAVSSTVAGLAVLVVILAATTVYGFSSSLTAAPATTTSTVTSTVTSGGAGSTVTQTVTAPAVTSTVTSTATSASTCTNPTPLIVQSYQIPDISSFPFYIADQLGFFKDECLTFQKNVLLFGDAGVTALLAGNINVETAPDPSAVAFFRGAQVKLVYTMWAGISYAFLTAKPGITSVSQLKTVASERQGTGTYAWISTLLQYYHSNATQVPFDTTTLRKAALIAGQVDAAPLTLSDYLSLQFQYPGQYNALVTPTTSPTSPYSASIPAAAALSNGVVVTQALIQQHPEVVQGLVRSLVRAIGVLETSPNATIPIIMKVQNYTRSQAELTYTYLKPMFAPYYTDSTGKLFVYNTIPATTIWYNGVATFNKVTNPPDVSTFVDYSFYNNVMKSNVESP